MQKGFAEKVDKAARRQRPASTPPETNCQTRSPPSDYRSTDAKLVSHETNMRCGWAREISKSLAVPTVYKNTFFIDTRLSRGDKRKFLGRVGGFPSFRGDGYQPARPAAATFPTTLK